MWQIWWAVLLRKPQALIPAGKKENVKLKVCLAIWRRLPRRRLSGIVEAVIQPHEGKKVSPTPHYKAFNFLSLRFKVHKLSTKHSSPLSQSNPTKNSLQLRRGGELIGKEEQTKAQSERLEITYCVCRLSKPVKYCNLYELRFDFKRAGCPFSPVGDLRDQHGASSPREDFRFFPDTQWRNNPVKSEPVMVEDLSFQTIPN